MKQIINKKYKVRKSVYGFYLLLLCLISSCTTIDEDLAPCKIDVKFLYDYNMKYVDLFAVQVDRVDLFIFDKDGIYIGKKSDSGDVLKTGSYTMLWDLPKGEYNLLAWAGLDDDDYELSELIPGQTNIKDVTLKVKRNSSLIMNKQLHPLWHGMKKNVVIDYGKTQQIVIPLIRDTNKVRIVIKKRYISGEDLITKDDCLIKAESNNGFYDSDNNLLSDDILTYEPYPLDSSAEYEEDKSINYIGEIDLMRLFENKVVPISISRISDGEVLLNEDLIRLIKENKMNFYTFPLQEYLDREYEFSFIFIYTNTAPDEMAFIGVYVTINGYTCWVQYVDFE